MTPLAEASAPVWQGGRGWWMDHGSQPKSRLASGTFARELICLNRAGSMLNITSQWQDRVFFCYKSILRKIRSVAEPRVPKFRSDLSDRLKDIAGKQVPAKLKPIVVSCWSNLTLTISQWTIPSSPFRAHERHSWHPHCWCWSNDAGRAACPLEMQLFPKNPLPVPHRTTSLQIITSNYRQTMAHYRQIPGMYMGFTIKEFRRSWRFTDKPGLFIAYYRR